MKRTLRWLGWLPLFCLSACAVGPDYKKPAVTVPKQYKEAKKNWKVAEPADECERGPWWEVFNDKQLDTLESRLNISNQSVAAAVGQYFQARAQVDEARAGFFPTLAVSASLTRQKNVSVSGGNSSSFATTTTTTTGSSGALSTGGAATSHTLQFTASWEPDIWGAVRRTVEASAANAQASAATLAALRLSSQSLLAQTYFQLRALDNDQKILDDTVKQDKGILTYTKNRYTSGVAAEADILQAKTQLETAEAAAINNGILRAQYEHAIAVLIGIPPGNFQIAKIPCRQKPPRVPLEVPSKLLERRPDVASAERLMAQANAQIGIAVAAYFPALTLSGSGGVTEPGYAKWFSWPALSWAVGAALSDTLVDFGLRDATVTAARANFDATVGTYRATVLTAFQNVEDNLVSVRTLKTQAKVQDQAALDAEHSLQIVVNEYRAGTTDYSSVLVAQNTALVALKAASDVHGQQMTAAVGLITALGGGWDVNSIAKAAG